MGIDKNKVQWYKNYLLEYFEVFKKFTKEDFVFYKSLNIDNTKSYYVISDNYEDLRKFTCFYLIIKYLRFSTYMISEFAEGLLSASDGVLESELIILYNHKHAFDVGGSQNAVWKKTLERVANRNRSPLKKRTILLTEKDVPFMRKSGEFIVLDLNNKVDPRNYITEGEDTVASSAQYMANKNKKDAKDSSDYTAPPHVTKEEMSSIDGANTRNDD